MRKLRLSPVLLTTIAVAVTGTHMGYGFIVSGVRDRTVTGNVDNSTREPLGYARRLFRHAGHGANVVRPARFGVITCRAHSPEAGNVHAMTRTTKQPGAPTPRAPYRYFRSPTPSPQDSASPAVIERMGADTAHRDVDGYIP